MINDRRACEITTAESSGSGLLITDRLVLTADHLLIGDHLQARLPEGSFACEVHWRSAELDAAVLRITDETWMSPELPPLRWGRLVTAAAGTVGEVAGFPEPHRADGACASGVLDVCDPAIDDRLSLHVRTWPRPPQTLGGSLWRGMSGAGLYTEGLLTGLIVEDPPELESRRLIAVPVEALCADPGFVAAVAPPPLEAAELAGLQTRPVPARPGPAGLLRAEAEVVPFHGRDDVLDRLRAWLDGAAPAAVRVLTGPGGQGKTRVARQFARAARDRGLLVVEVRADAPAALFERLAEVREKILLVVDDAEKQGDRLVRLAAALPGHVRLLLVARTGGAWLRELAVRSEPFAALLPPTWPGDDLGDVTEELGPLDGDRRSVFRAALKAFADRLGVAPPTVRTPQLTDDCYRNVLAVHLEALVRLLGVTDPVDGPDAASVLLEHETRHWSRQARAKYGLGDLPVAALRQAVAVATLCTVRRCPGEGLADLLARVPSLADRPAATREAVADWLTDLYGEPGWRCAPMHPDPLHEHLIGAELAANPAMLDGVAPEITERQAREMLTVLARAGAPVSAGRRRDFAVVVAVAGVIDSLIRRFPNRMAVPAWHAAALVEGPAAGPLHAALDAIPPTADETSRPAAGGPFRPIAEGWGARAGFRVRVAGAVALAAGLVSRWPAAAPMVRVVRQRPDLARTVGTGIAVVALASPLLLLVPESEAGQQGPPTLTDGVVAAAPPMPAPRVAEPTAAVGEPAAAASPPPAVESPQPTEPLMARPPQPVRRAVTSRPTSPAPTRTPVTPPPAARRPVTPVTAVRPSSPPSPAKPSVTSPAATAEPDRADQPDRPAGPGRIAPTGTPAPLRSATPAPLRSAGSPAAVTSAVRRFPIEIDASALTAPRIQVRGAEPGDAAGAVRRFRLTAGRYQLGTPAVTSDAWFTVTATGTIMVDPGVTYLKVRGGKRLEVLGVEVTVDARELAGATFTVEGVTSDPRPTAKPQSLRLLPVSGAALYRLHDGRGTAGFSVAGDGTVGYPDEYADHLTGAGTSTLKIRQTTLPDA